MQHGCCVRTSRLAVQIVFTNFLLKGFNKINNFYCFVKNVLQWNFECVLMYKAVAAAGWCHRWIYAKAPAPFPPLLWLCNVKCRHGEKANNTLILLSEVVLTLGTPWKGLSPLWGPHTILWEPLDSIITVHIYTCYYKVTKRNSFIWKHLDV